MKKARSKFTPKQEMIDGSGYVGKAGEHLVLAELLLRRFDAAIVAVDSGTDILAEKNGKLLRIQVKSCSLNKQYKQSAFAISEKTLERVKCDFYVIVSIDQAGHKIDHFVIPGYDFGLMVKDGWMRHQKAQRRFQALIFSRNGKYCMKNQRNDITQYLNAYGLIDDLVRHTRSLATTF